MEKKSALRKKILTSLRQRTPEEKKHASEKILQHLCASSLLNSTTNTVFTFAPLPSEPDLTGLHKKFAGTLAYPRMGEHRRLHFYPVQNPQKELHAETNRLQQPAQTTPIAPEKADLILVPGLAFSSQDGMRLGRGGGYYDTLLSALPPTTRTVGVCFHAQLHQDLPRENHDQAVDFLLTEEGIFTPKKLRPMRDL